MSYQLLHQIAQGPLPMIFTRDEDIDALRIFKDGGWIKANFVKAPGRRGKTTATVTELTNVGRIAMQFVQPDPKGKP
ncbi:conserved hypothetical protein [Burkholderiales bacterium 8X]|nr:conserved hypothetical protein [Burkholderiales bacterium 8X]